jgi:hypothetical protein
MSAVTCTHLDQIEVDRPDHVPGCEDCLAIAAHLMTLVRGPRDARGSGGERSERRP